jgi:hypothetical protein
LGVTLGAMVTLGALAQAQARPIPQPPGHTLTVTVTGGGAGTVTSSDASIACPPTCSHFYLSIAPVTLTATSAAGSTFLGWSGPCTGTASTCTVSMTSDQAVTATFAKAGSPPPAAPSCRLHLASRQVLLAAPKSKPALRGKVGKLAMSFHCNQTVSAILTIKVVERVHQHRVTFHLTRHYSLHRGRTRTFTLTLWRRALRGLAHHDRETITVAITGTDANGSSGTGVSAPLKGVG